MAINERAQAGFSNGAAYDQYRPTYTASAIDELLKQCRVAGKQHARILDLAAGTGKGTEALVSRSEQYEIIAVEPHDGMRDVLAEKKLPGVTVKSGTADSIPLDDESLDAVIIAQVGLNDVSSCLHISYCRQHSAQSSRELNARRPSTGSQTKPH